MSLPAATNGERTQTLGECELFLKSCMLSAGWLKNELDRRDPEQLCCVLVPWMAGCSVQFFMQDDPNRDLYQFAFAVALLWFLVQFLQAVI